MKNNKRTVSIIAGILFIVIILFVISPFLTLYLSPRYRTRAYIELTYRVIADRQTNPGMNQEEEMLALLQYTKKHVFLPANVAPWDATMLDYLVRGVGWCDHQSNVFNKLLSKKGIPARYVYLKDSKGVSPHTVSEVFFNGRWIVFDVFEGIFFKLPDGRYATLLDLSHNPSLILNHPHFADLQKRDPRKFEEYKEWYATMFPLKMEPERSKSFTEQNTLLTSIIDCYCRLFGNKFINYYQDTYLRFHQTSGLGKNYALFFAGRNYQLFDRAQKAEEQYAQLLKEFPQSQFSDDALFFWGIMANELKKNSEQASSIFHTLSLGYPSSKWIPFIEKEELPLEKSR